MTDQIFPNQELNSKLFDTLTGFEKGLEARLLGKTIKILFCNPLNNHAWEEKDLVVSRVEYHGNDNGYVDPNGPTFYDLNGVSYQTHPDFGVKIIDD